MSIDYSKVAKKLLDDVMEEYLDKLLYNGPKPEPKTLSYDDILKMMDNLDLDNSPEKVTILRDTDGTLYSMLDRDSVIIIDFQNMDSKFQYLSYSALFNKFEDITLYDLKDYRTFKDNHFVVVKDGDRTRVLKGRKISP